MPSRGIETLGEVMDIAWHWGKKRRCGTPVAVWLLLVGVFAGVPAYAYAGNEAVVQRIQASARTEGGAARAEVFVRTVEGGATTERYVARREGTTSATVRYSSPTMGKRKETTVQVRASSAGFSSDRRQSSARSGQSEFVTRAVAPATVRTATRARVEVDGAMSTGTPSVAVRAWTQGTNTATARSQEEDDTVRGVAPRSEERSATDTVRTASWVSTFISLIHNRVNAFFSYARNIF